MQISREKHHFKLKGKGSAMVLKWTNGCMPQEQQETDVAGAESFKQAYEVTDSTQPKQNVIVLKAEGIQKWLVWERLVRERFLKSEF